MVKVRLAQFTIARLASFGFKARKGRTSSELSQRNSREILELWSNRNSDHKEQEPLLSLRRIARGAEGIENLLHHPGYQHLFQCVSRSLGSAQIDDVAETLYTCAQHRLRDKKMVVLMAAELERRNLKCLSDRYLGFVPYGLVVLRVGIGSRPLIGKCVHEVSKRLRANEFSHPHSLALLCWALTNTDQWSSNLANVIHAYLKKQVNRISPSVLSTLLWALGRGKHSNYEIIKTVISNIVVDELGPVSQSQVFQTLGDVVFQDKRYFDALTEYVVTGRKGCLHDPCFINILVKTCAIVQYYHRGMMERLADAALEQLSKFSVSGLDATGHAFSSVNHVRKDLLLAVFKELSSRSKNELDFRGWINLAWACLVADIYPPELFQLRTWEQGG